MKRITYQIGKPYGTTVRHQPVFWKWWQFLKIKAYRTTINLPKVRGRHSFNVWFYTRTNARCDFFSLDLRKGATK